MGYKVLNILKSAIFIILFILSIGFLTWGEVLQKFLSNSTSFLHYSEPFYQSPTVTICFSHLSSINGTKLKFGKDFRISYRNKIAKAHYLVEGATEINVTKETLILEQMLSAKVNFQGGCFKLTHTISNESANFIRKFYIEFKKDLPKESLPKITLYFTSEENAYGITMKKWVDGKAFETDIEFGNYKRLDIYPTKYVYHDSTHSKCNNNQSFYECFGTYLLKKENKCSIPCLALTLPVKLRSNTTNTCKTLEEWKCSKGKSWTYFQKIQRDGVCKKSCQILQYEGKVAFSWGEKNWASFAYEIDPPEQLTVYQEYVVYDAIGIIGSVGGTLGLFIGFSFSGLISELIDVCSSLLKSKHGQSQVSHKNISRTEQYQNILVRLEALEKINYATKSTHIIKE